MVVKLIQINLNTIVVFQNIVILSDTLSISTATEMLEEIEEPEVVSLKTKLSSQSTCKKLMIISPTVYTKSYLLIQNE